MTVSRTPLAASSTKSDCKTNPDADSQNNQDGHHSQPLALFLPAAKGTLELLRDEAQALGASAVQVRSGGVAARGSLAVAYRLCFWSRLASRVLLQIATDLNSADAHCLYRSIEALPWEMHLHPEHTLSVAVTSRRSRLQHTLFASQRIKDGICDRLRRVCGARPSVDRMHADVPIHVHLQEDRATVFVDVGSGALHRRGYRRASVAAPLKETLAAAMLLRAGWPAIAAAGGTLVAPFCGSGTLAIEGAMIALDIAPGLLRDGGRLYGAWLGHDRAVWKAVQADAEAQRQAGAKRWQGGVVATDMDPEAVAATRTNAQAAGVWNDGWVCVRAVFAETLPAMAEGAPHLRTDEQSSGQDNKPGNEASNETSSEARGTPGGLWIANLPYGRRLETQRALYAQVGEHLATHFRGWQAAMLAGDTELGMATGLRARKVYALPNANHDQAQMLCFDLKHEERAVQNGAEAGQQSSKRHSAPLQRTPLADTEEGRALSNRLRKVDRHYRRWAKRRGISCYRVYDRDLSPFDFTVDRYDNAVVVQEWMPPGVVDPRKAAQRRRIMAAVVADALGVREDQVFWRSRARQRGSSQYETLAKAGEERVVNEGGHRFVVNLTDHLDTGLFLDHRQVRAWIQDLCATQPGCRFLNLFAYTAAATVYAAAGGAGRSVSVDLSRPTLAWAERNFDCNRMDHRYHRLVQADVLRWLQEETRNRRTAGFDVIFCDPPTFSNSKRMDGTLDIQRDHVTLLRRCLQLLAPGGVLIFSTNKRHFKLDQAGLGEGIAVQEHTRRTLPEDFSRQKQPRRVWTLEREREQERERERR